MGGGGVGGVGGGGIGLRVTRPPRMDERRKRRTQLLLYANLVCFILPMCAFLPSYTEWIIARRCAALQEARGPALRCDDDAVSEDAARWDNWLMQACNVPNFLVALPLGALADRWGRRPLLLANLLTQTVGSAGVFLACAFEWPLEAIVPTFIVNGCGGGSYSFAGLISCALVDTAGDDPVERASVLGRMMGFYYLSQAAGPVVGSALATLAAPPSGGGGGNAGDNGSKYVWVFAFFVLGNVLCLLATLAMRETMEQQQGEEEEEVRPAGELPGGGAKQQGCEEGRVTTTTPLPGAAAAEEAAVVAVAAEARPVPWRAVLVDPVLAAARSATLRPLALAYAFFYMGIMGFGKISLLLAKKDPFDLSSTDVGYFVAAQWLVRAAATLLLLPCWLRRQQRRQQQQQQQQQGRVVVVVVPHHRLLLRATYCGLAWGAALTLALGLTVARGSTALLFALSAAQGLDGMVDAACRPLFSLFAGGGGGGGGGGGEGGGGNVQGAVFGIVSWVQVATGVFAPLLYNNVYAWTVASAPGLTLCVISLTFACACGLVVRMRGVHVGLTEPLLKQQAHGTQRLGAAE